MQKLQKDGMLASFYLESFDTCEACLMGKMTKTPFTWHPEWARELLNIIHSDVCSPMSIPARGGYLYSVTFIEDLSRYGYIYLMEHKYGTFEKFQRISKHS